MNILNESIIAQKIQSDIIMRLLQQDYEVAIANVSAILDELYANIPAHKRISYGRVHTIKVLSQHLYTHLLDLDAPVYQMAAAIFTQSDNFKNKGVALGLLSFYGLDDYTKVLPLF